MKFSIITPSYNQGDYITQTIDSIVSQEGKFQIELIIMDGGSTDSTVEILKDYEKRLSEEERIKFIWHSEKDNGQADAINKGLAISTGEVLAYLNSDDIYEPGAFQAVAAFLEAHDDIGFLYGKCRIIDEEGSEIRKWITLYRTLLGRKYSYAKLLSENYIPQPATFWRRAVYEKYGDFDVEHAFCLDYEYWCRIGQGFEGAFLNEWLSGFRWYRSSKSGANYKQQFQDEIDIAKHYAKGKYTAQIALHYFNYYKIVSIYNLLRFVNG